MVDVYLILILLHTLYSAVAVGKPRGALAPSLDSPLKDTVNQIKKARINDRFCRSKVS